MVTPETQVVLPCWKGDLLHIMQACTNGTLENEEVKFSTVLPPASFWLPGGYPVAYEKGKPITGLVDGQLPGEENVTVYHLAPPSPRTALVTAGGRVLGVTATGPRLTQCAELGRSGEAAEDQLESRTSAAISACEPRRRWQRSSEERTPLSRLAATAPRRGVYAENGRRMLSIERGTFRESPFGELARRTSVSRDWRGSVQRKQRGNLPNGLSYLCGKKARL